jgi:hypothetical protein
MRILLMAIVPFILFSSFGTARAQSLTTFTFTYTLFEHPVPGTDTVGGESLIHFNDVHMFGDTSVTVTKQNPLTYLSPKPKQGDIFPFHNNLTTGVLQSNGTVDLSAASIKGNDNGYCIRTRNVSIPLSDCPASGVPIKGAGDWECSWSNHIVNAQDSKKGDIIVQGTFNDNCASQVAITGGTGSYAGVRGTLDLVYTTDVSGKTPLYIYKFTVTNQ